MLQTIAEVPRTDAIVLDREFSYVEQPKTFFEKYSSETKLARTLIINLVFGAYFAWATYYFVKNSQYWINIRNYRCICAQLFLWISFIEKWESKEENMWCDGYGMFFILVVFVYALLFYFKVIKRYFGRSITKTVRPYSRKIATTFERKKYTNILKKRHQLEMD